MEKRTMRLFRNPALYMAAAYAVSSPALGNDLVTHLFPRKDGEVDDNVGGNRDTVLRIGRDAANIILQR
jgi:hypothetical protein